MSFWLAVFLACVRERAFNKAMRFTMICLTEDKIYVAQQMIMNETRTVVDVFFSWFHSALKFQTGILAFQLKEKMIRILLMIKTEYFAHDDHVMRNKKSVQGNVDLCTRN